MPARYKDFAEFIEEFEDWAKRETLESQLNMLNIYRTLFSKGKIEMESPEEFERGREYVDARINHIRMNMQIVPT
jgi:hypothetical protein